MRFPFVSCAFVSGLAGGVACGSDEACPTGHEACTCAAGTCLTGLVCLSGYCVDPSWRPPGANDVGTAADDDGSDTFDNVSACNELVDAFDCGDIDLGMFVDCDLYGSLPCDVSDYFDCVRDEVQCVDGMFDAAQLGDCADLAQCS